MKRYRLTFEIIDTENKKNSLKINAQIQNTYKRENMIFDLTERQETNFYLDKLIEATKDKIKENFPE